MTIANARVLEIWRNTLLQISSAFNIRKLSLIYGNPEVCQRTVIGVFQNAEVSVTFASSKS